MELIKSKSLKLFKKEIGQANHMLITAIIGLDGIIPYNVEKLPEFDVSWNPNDKKQSVERSKLFIKKSSLSWIVDNIDMYFRLINQTPSVISDQDLKNCIDSPEVSRSVYKRLNKICSFLSITSIEYALVDLLICWRNRMVHYQAENDIQYFNKDKLIDEQKSIKQKYRHLDMVRTLNSFDNKYTPTFKEIASLIKATINLIYEIDSRLIKKLDVVRFADSVIVNHIKGDSTTRLNDIFSKGNETAYKKLRQILIQNGLTDTLQYNDVDDFCKNISELSFSQIKTHYENKTFLYMC